MQPFEKRDYNVRAAIITFDILSTTPLPPKKKVNTHAKLVHIMQW